MINYIIYKEKPQVRYKRFNIISKLVIKYSRDIDPCFYEDYILCNDGRIVVEIQNSYNTTLVSHDYWDKYSDLSPLNSLIIKNQIQEVFQINAYKVYYTFEY